MFVTFLRVTVAVDGGTLLLGMYVSDRRIAASKARDWLSGAILHLARRLNRGDAVLVPR